ncbi:hypothetical protein Holit_02202 [Hollandina sp. SP2]
MQKKTGPEFLFFSISLFFSCAGSCAIDRDETVRRSAADAELRLLMFQIETRIIHLDDRSDGAYIALALKVCVLIDMKGTISKDEHYFRNHFWRAPANLNAMVYIITETDNAPFDWRLSAWQETAFHTYGEDGAYNLKFISGDGHFEAVYNKDGELLTADNDPLNMGTFNYGDYQTENMKHLKYDVWPYFEWNNTREAAAMNRDEERTITTPIDKHPQAMARYREYEGLLRGGSHP